MISKVSRRELQRELRKEQKLLKLPKDKHKTSKTLKHPKLYNLRNLINWSKPRKMRILLR